MFLSLFLDNISFLGLERFSKFGSFFVFPVFATCNTLCHVPVPSAWPLKMISAWCCISLSMLFSLVDIQAVLGLVFIGTVFTIVHVVVMQLHMSVQTFFCVISFSALFASERLNATVLVHVCIKLSHKVKTFSTYTTEEIGRVVLCFVLVSGIV